LDGITVIGLEQAVAAPFATRQLADLGARVIKIERPDGGDFARGYDTVVGGESSAFVWLNRGKESVQLDLAVPDGLAVLHRLLARADVLVPTSPRPRWSAAGSPRPLSRRGTRT
jgi:crotonobetainyl-CoA:carnitine CoA-transferase CaiB-like acyl-CoA transferase